ncbi:MAG: hypothetical protein C0605_07005 [Hyphomicrobiales bacterium]|nr:MAG: hypothetical protein C0605_07005 [Hyphomicrobiales bacterium]
MYRMTLSIFRILVASLLMGLILSHFGITAEKLFSEIGISSEGALEMIRRTLRWAAPHIALGVLVILPVWLAFYLFRPPRS